MENVKKELEKLNREAMDRFRGKKIFTYDYTCDIGEREITGIGLGECPFVTVGNNNWKIPFLCIFNNRCEAEKELIRIKEEMVKSKIDKVLEKIKFSKFTEEEKDKLIKEIKGGK